MSQVGCYGSSNAFGRAIESSDERLAGVLNKARMWERLNQRPVNDRQRLVINQMLSGFKGFSEYVEVRQACQML